MFLHSADGTRLYNMNMIQKLEKVHHPTRDTYDIQINGEVLISFNNENAANREMTWIVNAISSGRNYYQVGSMVG